MTILSLPPSEIRYTQDSIGTTFGRCTNHAFQPIGKTLDDLLKGSCSIYTIPNISVTKKNRKYYTADNRRLWVFRKAEELGKCDSIPVNEIEDYFISPMKWTTHNDGESLYVRGDPGGSYWKTLTPKPIVKRYINEIRENEMKGHNEESTFVINNRQDECIKVNILEVESKDTVDSEENDQINKERNNGDDMTSGCDNKVYLDDEPKDSEDNGQINNGVDNGDEIISGCDNEGYLNDEPSDNDSITSDSDDSLDTPVTGDGVTPVESNQQDSSSDSDTVTVEDNISVQTLDSENSSAVSTSKYENTESPSAVVQIEMETNKNEHFSFQIPKSKNKSCCIRNEFKIAIFVVIIIVIALLIVRALDMWLW